MPKIRDPIRVARGHAGWKKYCDMIGQIDKLNTLLTLFNIKCITCKYLSTKRHKQCYWSAYYRDASRIVDRIFADIDSININDQTRRELNYRVPDRYFFMDMDDLTAKCRYIVSFKTSYSGFTPELRFVTFEELEAFVHKRIEACQTASGVFEEA